MRRSPALPTAENLIIELAPDIGRVDGCKVLVMADDDLCVRGCTEKLDEYYWLVSPNTRRMGFVVPPGQVGGVELLCRRCENCRYRVDYGEGCFSTYSFELREGDPTKTISIGLADEDCV